VHLACDSPAFVFLRKDEAGEQFRAGSFGTLTFGHLLSQRGVGACEFSGAFADARFELFVRTAERFLGVFPFGEIEVSPDDADYRSTRLRAHGKTA